MQNPNANPIIVNATIGNQQRQFLVVQYFPYAGSYHVWCGQEYVAIISQLGDTWKVSPSIGSWLEHENTDPLLQAVLNDEFQI